MKVQPTNDYRHLHKIYENAVLRDELKEYETVLADTIEA